MSYILDALNKSEQERREEHQVPSLLAVHDNVPHQPPRPAISVWLPVAAVLLVLVVYLLVTLLANGPAQTPAAPQASSISPTIPQAATPPAAPPIQPVSPVQPLPISPTTAKVDSNTATPTAARIQDLYAANPDPAPAGGKQSPQQSDAAVPDNASAPAETTASERETLQKLLADEEARKLAAQIQADSYQPYVPGIQQLSPALRNQLPALNYSAHIYSADEKSGFVIINGRKRYAGMVIAPELFVESIREDDVVLNFQGYSFALPAMRSWHGR